MNTDKARCYGALLCGYRRSVAPWRYACYVATSWKHDRETFWQKHPPYYSSLKNNAPYHPSRSDDSVLKTDVSPVKTDLNIKVEVNFPLITSWSQIGSVGYRATHSLASAVDRDEWLTPRPSLTPGKRSPLYQLITRLRVPQSRPGQYEEKSSSPTVIRAPNRPSRSLVAIYRVSQEERT